VKALATTTQTNVRTSKTARDIVTPNSDFSPTSSSFSSSVIHRKASCACGGGCSACQAKSNLNVSQPNDPAEIEADQIADKVMRMVGKPAPGIKASNSPDTIHRKCDTCEEEDEKEIAGPVMRKEYLASVASTHPPVNTPSSMRNVLNSGGQSLEIQSRSFFEPLFGHDFSHVRIHDDAHATALARGVNAKAFTLGRDIVFGGGQYAPDTAVGRRLLAHELTHILQQGATGAKAAAHSADGGGNNSPVHVAQQGIGGGMIQRDVVIEPTDDTTDPAHDMPVENQRDIVRALVQQLCAGFDVPASSPLRVEDIGGTCGDLQSNMSAPHTGCCCLCVLTAPGAARWKIIVSQNDSPHTDESSHTVVINPSGSPIESLHWTDSSGAGERMINRPRVITFGHELCGHAALMEIGSHPAHAGRVADDVHDPTIKVEREIWGEQGLPASDQRGLAGGGRHRGESVYRLTLDRFPSDVSDPSRLPSSERSELAELKRFSSSGSWVIEVHGHSDDAGSSSVRQDVSDRRATSMRDDLAASSNGSGYTFVKIEGHSNGQALTGASPGQLRRVDIVLSLFRAGVPTLPPTSSPVTHIGPDDPARHAANLLSADPCINHLATVSGL
jgi:hypothetical protein